jgi:hypothetical protein
MEIHFKKKNQAKFDLQLKYFLGRRETSMIAFSKVYEN